MKLSQIKVDSAAIENGAWRKAVGFPGIEFNLRGVGNAEWERLHSKLVSELPPEAKFADVLPKEHAERISVDVIVGACLLDWRGIEEEDGSAIPYSADLARKLLSDPDMRKLKDSILATAGALSRETAAEREAAAKN